MEEKEEEEEEAGEDSARQARIRSWRRGFMRCSRREEPWGSHHSAARAVKWETSLGLTEEKVEWHRDVGDVGDGVVVVAAVDGAAVTVAVRARGKEAN